MSMQCPFCGTLDNRVVDSRLSQGGEVTRRRRECDQCSRRYTTYERVERTLPLIVKKGGGREPYDRSKLQVGLQRASVKRPISTDAIERLLDAVERSLADRGEVEVSSADLGEQVLDALKELDEVAYVRFASVYREFQDVDAFVQELEQLKRSN